MALPPAPILLICVLAVADVVYSVMAVIGMAAFAAWTSANEGMSGLFSAGAFMFALLLLAQIAFVVGLFLARRWAVIVGALSFKLAFLGVIMPGSFWWVTSMIPLALFLVCTLP